jgi:CubicO group peptidase (beta-lactamase class C family)
VKPRLGTASIAFSLLTLALAVPPVVLAQAVDPAAVDAIVREALKAWQVPGAAVAVVRGDEVVYLKGHGVREIGKPEPVTPETILATGSCTKAFTATAVAMLVDEGKMAWDDPVRKYVAFFRLADPLADANVTLRDLLSMRTGLDRHDILWYGSPLSREELIRRIGLVPLDQPFRSRWQYQNLTYLTAGYAVGVVSKSSWEAFVQQRILDPLGMTGADFTTTAAEKVPNHATPHRKNAVGTVVAIPWRNIDNVAPAGAINADARDMTRWVRFQLGEGSFEGKRLLSVANLEETHTPQMVMPTSPAAREAAERTGQGHVSYGMGWMMQDYRGHRLVQHRGDIDGFTANVALLPRDGLGIVVLTNLDVTPMVGAVTNSVIDLVLGLAKTDWNATLAEFVKKGEAQQAAARKERLDKRHPGTKPARALGDYTGAYEDPAYGPASVSLENGALVLRWNGSTAPLEHFHFDTFTLKGDSVLAKSATEEGQEQVVFTLGADGEVATMRLLGREFKRAKRPSAARRPEPWGESDA